MFSSNKITVFIISFCYIVELCEDQSCTTPEKIERLKLALKYGKIICEIARYGRTRRKKKDRYNNKWRNLRVGVGATMTFLESRLRLLDSYNYTYSDVTRAKRHAERVRRELDGRLGRSR